MGVVIDTSALVAAERLNGAPKTDVDAWRRVLGQLVAEPAVLPAAVYAELMAGVFLADSPTRAAARRAKIVALTARVPIVHFGQAIAEEWVRLFVVLSRKGELIPTTDLAVAATAKHLDFDVLVGATDAQYFCRVPDLRVKTFPSHT
jgi:predicted nucleic acid-binding protein